MKIETGEEMHVIEATGQRRGGRQWLFMHVVD
jgi:hypothetical protein